MVDTSLEGLSATFGSFMTGNIGELIVQVMFWCMIIAAVCLVGGIIYLFTIYKHKFIIFKGYGDGTGGRGIGKPRFDFAKENKDGSWQLLLRRKYKIEPFQDKFVYPGNWVTAYEIDGTLTPGCISMGKDQMVIEPVPYVERKKIELDLKQNALDFAKIDTWEANKIFIYTLIGAGMVIVLAGFVLWMAFKKTDEIIPALNAFSNSVANINNIPGRG